MSEVCNEPLSIFDMGFFVTKRGTASKALDYAQEVGVLGGIVFLGRGTAKNSVLDLWGLEQELEYEIILLNIPKFRTASVIRHMSKNMRLKEPGRGIMFTVPSLGTAGLIVLKKILEAKGITLPDMQQKMAEEEYERVSVREFALIISIINRGYADDAMDAAREAGAEGGIIINGRGAGFTSAEQFLGINIEQEREILLNVVEKKKVNKILKSIVEKAGIKTEARGISLVLPVNDANGVVHLAEDSE